MILSKPRILVSISGGRTSAMMAAMIKKLYGRSHDILYVFANTSREKEETLVFLQRVDEHFALGVNWIEAVVHHGRRKSCTHKVVDFASAKRDGSVFEEVIKKYGIPSTDAPHCTRELKTRPIEDCARAFGWAKGTYQIAIGYRADEPKRIKLKKIEKDGHFYILNDAGIKKPDVAFFWSQQPFDLELPDYDGNCKLCHKKSKRKVLTQIVETPGVEEWHIRMEREYGHVCPAKYEGTLPMKFFREGDSIHELLDESKLPFEKAVDRSRDTNGYNAAVDFDLDLDYEDADCGASCEPFAA